MASEHSEHAAPQHDEHLDEEQSVALQYPEHDRSIAFYNYGCTQPRLDRPPVRHFDFPILKAPSEIRNLIYKYWLAADLRDAMTNEEYNDDFDAKFDDDWEVKHPRPKSFKPWRALERLDRCTSNGEVFHFTRMTFEREVPKLWGLNRQVRREAMDVHLNQGMILEVETEARYDESMFEKWVARMSENVLKGIRNLHVIADCMLVAQPGDFSRKVQYTSNVSKLQSTFASCECPVVQLGGWFDHGDALFKLELLDRNRLLSVRTFCQLMPFQEEALKQAVKSYVQNRWCWPN
jgi:hypothetical protein